MSQSQTLCVFFKKGKCKYGEECRFRHDVSEMDSVGVGSKKQRPVPISSPSQTCNYFSKMGKCRYGTACRYRHDHSGTAIGSDLKTRPKETLSGMAVESDPEPQPVQYPTNSPPPTYHPDPAPTKTCKYFFKTGNCRHGTACRFLHLSGTAVGSDLKTSTQESLFGLAIESDPEPQRVQSPTNSPPPTYQPHPAPTKPCKYFSKTGSCRYDTACRFLHISGTTVGSDLKTSTQEILFGLAIESDPEPQPVQSPTNSPPPTYQPHPTPTKPCKYFSKTGSCRDDTACRFLHLSGTAVGSDLKTPPHETLFGLAIKSDPEPQPVQSPTNSPPPTYQPHPTPTKPCTYFAKTGSCRYDTACRFSHLSWTSVGSDLKTRHQNTPSGIVLVSDPEPQPPTTLLPPTYHPHPTPTKPCKCFSKTGNCKYRMACRFLHVSGTAAKSDPKVRRHSFPGALPNRLTDRAYSCLWNLSLERLLKLIRWYVGPFVERPLSNRIIDRIYSSLSLRSLQPTLPDSSPTASPNSSPHTQLPLLSTTPLVPPSLSSLA
ncbi:hypothetical protein JAAARDRAFT_434453 [Jaapia argillacea MUCL 33604]|uniref:C3H1-type domain-containing protein n=1 Tax=Jaapia argillacea MUCL 33604 TaxID=933084 RepID=A0A067PHS9_9AGAM|nr:hypothetical protein JAAARDRAFT_434453 [Jaapia argillacea MUCL 33604]